MASADSGTDVSSPPKGLRYLKVEDSRDRESAGLPLRNVTKTLRWTAYAHSALTMTVRTTQARRNPAGSDNWHQLNIIMKA